MAEVTIVAGSFLRVPYGDQVQFFARVNIANSGDTWSPRLARILAYGTNPAVTAITEGTDSSAQAFPNLAFTTAGPLNNVPVWVNGFE